MADRAFADMLQPILRILDPRRSLVVGAVWLIIGLAVAFSIAADGLGRQHRARERPGTAHAAPCRSKRTN